MCIVWRLERKMTCSVCPAILWLFHSAEYSCDIKWNQPEEGRRRDLSLQSISLVKAMMSSTNSVNWRRRRKEASSILAMYSSILLTIPSIDIDIFLINEATTPWGRCLVICNLLSHLWREGRGRRKVFANKYMKQHYVYMTMFNPEPDILWYSVYYIVIWYRLNIILPSDNMMYSATIISIFQLVVYLWNAVKLWRIWVLTTVTIVYCLWPYFAMTIGT